MGKNDNNSGSAGIGFCGALFITFLVLKLCGVIDWSWWWVTAPLWGPIALIPVFLIVYLIIVVFFTLLSKLFD